LRFDQTKSIQHRKDSPVRSRFSNCTGQSKINKNVFKTNSEDNGLICDFCGEFIMKGKLSICKNERNQIHYDHIKKNN
jgi:hypothetical protein